MISANASQQREVEHQGKTEEGCCKVRLLCSADYIPNADSSTCQGETPLQPASSLLGGWITYAKAELAAGCQPEWLVSTCVLESLGELCEQDPVYERPVIVSCLYSVGLKDGSCEGKLTWRLSRPPAALQPCWRQHKSRELVDQDRAFSRLQNSTGTGYPTSLVGIRQRLAVAAFTVVVILRSKFGLQIHGQ